MEVEYRTEQGIELDQHMCRMMNLYDLGPVVLCRTVSIGNSERTVHSLTNCTKFPCNNFQINTLILRQQICFFFTARMVEDILSYFTGCLPRT